jgi:osmotically inducible lipoprotein OsmB
MTLRNRGGGSMVGISDVLRKRIMGMAILKTGMLALGAAAALTACTTDDYGNRELSRGGKGAAIGAAGGAAVGALTGGNVLAGAAIGAAAGAVLGVVTEDKNRYEDRNGYRYYSDQDGRQYRYDERRRKRYGPNY